MAAYLSLFFKKAAGYLRKQWRYIAAEDIRFWCSLLILMVVPLLPEYAAPVLAPLSLLFAVQDAKNRGTYIRLGMPGKLLLLFIAYSTVGIVYSDHPLNSISTVLMWVVMFCCYLTLTTLLHTQKRLYLALFVLGAVAGVVGFIACIQYVLRDVLDYIFPNQFWLRFDQFFYRYFPMEVNLEQGMDRVASTFNNPNVMAEYLVMVLPFAGYYGFSGRRTPAKLVARVFLAVAICGTILSFSRGAYIALLSMLLLIVLTHLRQITPFMMCITAIIAIIPEAILSRFLSIGDADTSILGRFDAWEVALQTIIRHPLFGLGPGISNFWEELTRMGLNLPHSHNLVLQLLVEGGFIALFLMCLVATRLLQNSMSLLGRSKKAAGMGLTVLLFSVSFVVYGMVDYPFLSPKLVGTFCMALGFADAAADIYSAEQCAPLHTLFVPLCRWVKQLPVRFRKS